MKRLKKTNKLSINQFFLAIVLIISTFGPVLSQDTGTTQTNKYVIEIAGIKVGTMTAKREKKANETVLYTLISDVKVNLLIYKVIVYYKTVSLYQQGKLVRATTEARTNKGNFLTQTEWKGDHYDVVANQYKYTHKATITQPIDYSLSDIYFGEPTGRNRIYSEYFGDYFAFTSPGKGDYVARLSDREDEYFYEKGELVKVIKKNSLKNFIIRPVK